MEVWKELFGTFEGLLSLAVIIFMLGMFVYFGIMAYKNIKADTEKHKNEL
ncbi:DUF3149 domain-containing protein [Pleionea sp. CnH1-48]|nr:DUF3149 domain-containing protein [Pleionea sp. CnH1-48]MCO7226288.1 DUF3149 domain-containing protein [Pleionea sp. CnH1-48]